MLSTSLQAGQEVVKTGTFLYDGQITCDVRIVRGPIFYGSGDYEDPLEIADDHEREIFCVQYGSPTKRGCYNAGGGSYPTLSDAIDAVEATPGLGCTVKWAD
jgi:hypothetical protein